MFQEIESLKAQLKAAHEKAANTTSPTSPDSGNLIDLSSSSSDNLTEVERKLKAERSARHDMEMHVTTLNSQRSTYVITSGNIYTQEP